MPPISLSILALCRNQPSRLMDIYRKYFRLDTRDCQTAKKAVRQSFHAGDCGDKLSHHIDIQDY